VSEVPEGAIDQARELVGLVKRGTPLERVTLIIFVRGRWVREDALREAYKRELERLEQRLMNAAGNTSDPFEIAEVFASECGLAAQSKTIRDLRRNIKRIHAEFVESPDSTLASVLTNVAHILLSGESTYDQALEELVVAALPQGFGIHTLPDDIHEVCAPVLKQLRLCQLRDFGDRVPIEQLHRFVEPARIAAASFIGEEPEFLAALVCLVIAAVVEVARDEGWLADCVKTST
jgi:hypothetical protein